METQASLMRAQQRLVHRMFTVQNGRWLPLLYREVVVTRILLAAVLTAVARRSQRLRTLASTSATLPQTVLGWYLPAGVQGGCEADTLLCVRFSEHADEHFQLSAWQADQRLLVRLCGMCTCHSQLWLKCAQCADRWYSWVRRPLHAQVSLRPASLPG
jgi:hypothetical protein